MSLPQRLATWLVAFYLVLAAHTASARVVRFAVLIGNNRGAAGQVELRHAEAEALRMQEVLRDVGGVAPGNSVVLRGENAASVRGALIAMNDRVRTASSGGDQAMLFVYYSGHADSSALHLNGTNLDSLELEQLVRGSAATLRLLVIDACRSGALTRRKGGKPVAPFAIALDDRLAGEGMVLLTSTAANEDAQESDELRGSFFTHALVSALLGAADINGDGLVVLEEAYRYAYESTLRSTSRSWAGTQHPTFRFDLRGQGGVVLSDLKAHAASRATLSFPPGRSYLVLQRTANGAVVAEVGVADRSRRLWLKPGRYFVRGRAPDYVLEGDITAAAGTQLEVTDSLLKRVEYARLVRKGGSDITLSHGPQIGYRLRSPIDNASTVCHGPAVGYTLDTKTLTIVPRIGFCHASFENERIGAGVDELDWSVRFARTWDTSWISFGAGLGLGGAWLHQGFTTLGQAPARNTMAGEGALAVGAARELGRGFDLFVDLEGLTYVFRLAEGKQDSTRASFALRTTLGLGKRF